MKFTPQGSKILLRKTFEQYKGILVIPDTARKNPPVEGTVVAIGEDVTDFVKVSDTIVFGKYCAEELNDTDMIGEDTFAIVLEGEIMYKKGVS